MEKRTWYAVVKDEKDDWYYGSVDLNEAKKMATELGSSYMVKVIDDTDMLNPKCIKTIKQNDF